MSHNYKVGDHVRIHPASDYFMMGVVYGIVTSIKGDVIYVRPNTIGIHAPSLRMKLRADLLLGLR